MSRARLSGPTDARLTALTEVFAEAVSDRLMLDRQARGLLALIQEHDADLYEIDVTISGRLLRGRPFAVGGSVTIPVLGIREPAIEPDAPRRGKAPRTPRKRKPRPAA